MLGSAADPNDGAAQLRDPALNAVLHGVNSRAGSTEDPRRHSPATSAAIRRHTTAPIILLATESEPWLVEAALAAGVDDVLVLPAAAGDDRVRDPQGGQAGGRDRLQRA